MRAFAVAMVICTIGALAYFAVERVIALRELTAPPTPEAFVQATWTVYKHGPGHRIHVSEQGIACSECHAEGSAGAFDRPSPSKCGTCHEDALGIEHAQVALDAHGKRATGGAAVKTMTDCLTCHGFGPDPAQRPDECMRCHAREKHDTPAVSIHAEQTCTSCHDVHENQAKPIACEECHEISAKHGGHTQSGAAQCLECHHAHAPASTARDKCVACHAGAESPRPVAASAASHGHACTGCHQPHDFSKQDVRACTSCHASTTALQGAGHRECTACHEPHAARDSVRTGNVCTGCHRKVALTHPAHVSEEKSCTGCHAPHPARGAGGPAPCTQCHRDVAQSELSAHAQSVACVACHVPHDFSAPSRGHAACESCHAPRIKQLAHARCEDCHRALPHGGLGSELPCAQCHEQGAQVHKGHARCVQCHDPHTGLQVQNCQSCHAQEAAQLHPRHGKCQNCHEPHHATPSAEVAACSACHTPSKLPALHQVAEHRPCQSCHQAHPEAPPGQAATCRACHTDKADHQPEATQCNGCHPFEAPPERRRR
jgi:hypothetical protein